MTEVAARPVRARETPKEYVARLLAALGMRDPFEVLGSTAAELRRAIAGLDAGSLSVAEGPGRWSIRQVLQHLADSELVGGFRIRMILAQERPALAAYDQERWAEQLGYAAADSDAALTLFEVLRDANLRLLRRTTAEQRARVGLHSERGEESIEQMILNYAGHDIVHLQQIARIRRVIAA